MTTSAVPRTLVFDPIGARRFVLRVAGQMPLGWSAIVAANLSALGCDVEVARANVDIEREWTGTFEGTRPVGLVSIPSEHKLLVDAVSMVTMTPRVTSYELHRHPVTGRLDLRIRAQDASGLLAGLLRQFGMLGLFPQNFDVRTIGGLADDKFTLSGIGGSRVSDVAERELARALTRWSAPPPPMPNSRHV